MALEIEPKFATCKTSVLLIVLSLKSYNPFLGGVTNVIFTEDHHLVAYIPLFTKLNFFFIGNHIFSGEKGKMLNNGFH